MDLNKNISLTKSELITTFIAFSVILLFVFGSRLIRLTSDSAIVFPEKSEIIFHEAGGVDSLSFKLKKHGFNFDDEELAWAANILGWRKFQRGRYELDGRYSYNGLLSKLARGIQDPVPVVIVPGVVPEKLSNDIAEKMSFSSDEFMEALTDPEYLNEKGLTKEQLFGRMYPETYLVYWTSSPKDILQKITREFESSVTQTLNDRISEMGVTVDEVLAMASIVEWEAKDEQEKPVISGLYWNRLKRGMRLQADPTVNFAVGERRRLLFDDYKLDHAFNTYVNKGLPPGPITNPSLSTIRATVNPEDHDFLYMVANPKGGHVFTRTFEEHRKESEKWRTWLRQQYRIKRQQEAAAAASTSSK